MRKAKKITVSAILIALTVVLLYLAAFFPVMSLSLIAIAGLLPAVAIIECGVSYSAAMYLASCILTLLLIPDKSCAILYAVLFGNYPFVKYFAERIKSHVLSWCIKIGAANALFALLFFVFRSVLLSFVPDNVLLIVTIALFNIIFIMYDFCFTKLTAFYMTRVHQHIV